MEIRKKSFFNLLGSDIKAFLSFYFSGWKEEKKVLFFAYFSSLILMLITPISTIFWLFPFFLYFLFKKKYLYGFLVYTNYFLGWYLLFCIIFVDFNNSIIIESDLFFSIVCTSERSIELFEFVRDKYVGSDGLKSIPSTILFLFSIESLYMGSCISAWLNEPVEVIIVCPWVFKGLLSLTRSIKNLIKGIFSSKPSSGKGGFGTEPPVGCSPEENEKNSGGKSWFWKKNETKKGHTEHYGSPFTSPKNSSKDDVGWNTGELKTDQYGHFYNSEPSPKSMIHSLEGYVFVPDKDFKMHDPYPSPKGFMGTVKNMFGMGEDASISPNMACEDLKPFLKKKQKVTDLYNEEVSICKGNFVKYYEVGAPWKKHGFCYSRPATKTEMDNADILLISYY